MPRISLTQPEIAALLSAVISREMELHDEQTDAETTLVAYETYEDNEITARMVTDAEEEIDRVQTESEHLESASRKLVRVRANSAQEQEFIRGAARMAAVVREARERGEIE